MSSFSKNLEFKTLKFQNSFIGEHMLGNVYVKFVHEEDADKCVKELENRWYNLKLIPIY